MVDPIHVMIALPERWPDTITAPMQAVSPRIQVEVAEAETLADLGGRLEQVEVLLTSLGMPSAEQAPRLRWAQAFSAGVDGWLRRGADRLSSVTLTTASGVHAPVMAEYSLTMMLAWAHVMPQLAAYQARHEWPDDRWQVVRPTELRGATLGVVGYGSIGRETARLACALGMRVVACKRNPEQRADAGWTIPGTGDPAGELPERYYGMERLHDMLGESDYVQLTLALTPSTRHIIDAAALRSMKPSAVLVNVGRGSLVDEPAMIEALQTGVIRAAGLDVFEQEPLPADSPLWAMPNVLVTPHIAGINPALTERLASLFTENLRRYVAGQPLLNRFDPGEGY